MLYQTKSFWLLGDTYPLGGVFLYAQDRNLQPVSQSAATTTTGWRVAKTAASNWCSMTASTEAAANSFKAFPAPNGLLSSTIGEGWILGPFTGVFKSPQTMSLKINMISTTWNAQRGRLTFRLWRRPSYIGNNATLLTPDILSCSLAPITTAVSCSISASIPIASPISMQNEYLFIESAWGITTAGGSNGCDVFIRQGSGSYFTTGPYEDNMFIPLSDDDNPGWTII